MGATGPHTILNRVKVEAVLADLKTGLVALYGKNLYHLVLYGSYARGSACPGSDLDVAAILDDFERPWPVIDRTGALVAELSLKHGVTISLIPVRKFDWERQRTLLAKSLHREGVEVG